MIQFIQIGNGDQFIGCPVSVNIGYRAEILFLLPQHPFAVTTIDTPVDDSRENLVGDRACHHLNASGTVFLIPKGMINSGPVKRTTYQFVGATKLVQGPEYFPNSEYTFRRVPGDKYLYTASHVVQYGMPYSTGVGDFVAKNSTGTTYYESELSLDITWPRLDRCIVTAQRHEKLVSSAGITTADRVVYTLLAVNFAVDGRKYSYSRLTGNFDYGKGSLPYSSLTDVTPSTLGTNIMAKLSGWTDDVSRLHQLVRNYVHGYLYSVENYRDILPVGTWGDLAHTAVQDARELDINTALYLADLVKIRDVLKTVKNLRRFNLKNLSKAYLMEHYGISLTISDTLEVRDALRRLSNRIPNRIYNAVRASTNVSSMVPFRHGRIALYPTSELHYKIYYDPVDSTWRGDVKSLMDWDFFPSLQNCWDIIPYSFVVDWFVDVQEALNKQDTKTYISVLNVLSVLKSKRTVFPSITPTDVLPEWMGKVCTGNISVVRYDRWSQPTCDIPLPSLGTSNPTNHWLEGSALLLSRRR